jgi:excisionase family DNA binding protein
MNMSTSRQPAGSSRLLTPAEAAAIFRADPETVTRWARDGKLTAVRTLGGHRRFPETGVRALPDQTAGPGRPSSPGA